MRSESIYSSGENKWLMASKNLPYSRNGEVKIETPVADTSPLAIIARKRGCYQPPFSAKKQYCLASAPRHSSS